MKNSPKFSESLLILSSINDDTELSPLQSDAVILIKFKKKKTWKQMEWIRIGEVSRKYQDKNVGK